MQLIIKNGLIIATHEDHQDIARKYSGCECILWHETLPQHGPEVVLKDPRTKKQKAKSYMDKRRIAYPQIQEQLDMLYHDRINGTTTWVDTIRSIKERYPK